MGFVTTGHGVSVHRTDCSNAESLQRYPERIIKVAWSPTEGSMFLVQLQVEALDRPGLLTDVTRVLSEQHVNILSASVQTSRDRVALSRFSFEMADPSHLESVVRAVRRVSAVLDAYRITGTSQTDPHRRHRSVS
jgi:GTP pyrophosphokinase